MTYDILGISLNRTVMLCGMNVYPNPEYHPDRTMLEHDILYICEGEWTITQDDETYFLKTDDAILLRAGSHHYCPVMCAPGTRTMFVHFNRLFGDRTNIPLDMKEINAQERAHTACLSTLMHCQQTEVSEYLQRIIYLFWSDRADRQTQASLLINLLLTELAHVVGASQQMHGEQWIMSVLRLFRSEPGHNYKLEELASFARVSERTLSEHFKRVTGQSVHQYQLNMKLEMAYTAICNTTRTLRDIAADFGFYDAYQFSRLFKRKYGKSPKHYRLHNPSLNINRPQF
ncbi:MAG: AraC family transcriptional regulator [Eubacteriales bacterium]|nr:AraC family transcriptional regulator [Eubacteriales bacterium]